ncbi:outer membrane protein assembly factor BamE domain-containing protein [Blastomonas sp. CACIA14H2]|uniref:outer membrane protein assembly factor BamE domain-containing protein n=1 Tax=Blastomonas sp. CACIA14H2 TaxID=1419876 RepID=UPI0004CE21FD
MMTSKAPTPRATRFPRPRAAWLVALAALPLLAGCGQLRGHQGFIYDQTLAGQILPGVDNRQSVERTLGRPTFTGQFSDSEWYYFARDTRQLAFANPRPTAQQVMRVKFDAAGNVAAVDFTGLDQVAKIDPEGDKTPTLGRKRTFFQDLFGNIGAVGAPGAGAGAPQ